MEASLARGFTALRTLDIVVVNAVRRDPVVAAAWEGGDGDAHIESGIQC